MKTSSEVIADLKSLIIPVEPSLSGGKICEYNRPLSSKENDVVINLIGASNEYMQFAIGNINLHAKNPSITLSNGKDKDNSQPNVPVFNSLASLIIPLIKRYAGNSFRVELRKDNGLIRDNDGSWYQNLQVNYWSLQNESTA
ncbi:MAG: hypothetical protein EOO42_01260 [Flavobacteriales bacterium]|nr:MAG: hypothetical protein EOO42_01260 [Flavobacteriales bacterium]